VANTVGIIANPASGKDIRRIVAYGAGTGNSAKVNIIRRLVMGMHAVGVKHILYMPDYMHIVASALDGLYAEHRSMISDMVIEPVDIGLFGTESDSENAAAAMRESGVKCIVTLGGDGTNRAVAKESGDVPLLPVSTGTNNTFPSMIEGTVAGIAAGAFATCLTGNTESAVRPSKLLEIYTDDALSDIALMDVVVLDETHIASRAMWKPDSFEKVFLTCCSPISIGVTSIGGHLEEIGKDADYGMTIDMDRQKQTLRVPLVPGVLTAVGIQGYRLLPVEERIDIANTPRILAVDGERDIQIRKGQPAYIRLTWRGPKVLDVPEIMRQVRREKTLFVN
jgi:hypothetical protein